MRNFLKFGINLTSVREKTKILAYSMLLVVGVSFEGLGFYGFSILVKSKIVVNSPPFEPIFFIRSEEDFGFYIVGLIIFRTFVSAWALQKISQTVIQTQSRFAGQYLEALVKNSGGQRQVSAAEISRSIETSTSYIFTAMQSLILIFGEIFSMLSLFIVAFYLAGFNFLAASAPILIVVVLIGRILKPRLTQSAEILSTEARNYVSDALEASSISQVVFGQQRLKFLIDRFILSRERSGKAFSKVIFIQQMPRYILETSTIVMLVLAFTFSREEFISSLVLVAPLLLRLLPSLIKLSNLLFDVAKGKPFLEKLQFEIASFQSESFASAYNYEGSTQFSITADGIQPQIGEGFLNDPLSFRVEEGQILGIVGSSGAGKSSLIECLIKKRNYQGVLTVHGPNVDSNEYSFAYVPQHNVFLRDTLLNNLLLGKVIENPEAKVRDALKLAGLHEFVGSINTLIDDYGSNGVRLSGGERARLSFARALVAEPNFIILDELTSGLDEQTELQILSTIQKLKLNKVIIIISHRESVMKICDKLITIRKNDER
jgi:ABC-type multidrug transport system fused ATPase/permease subunit